MCWQPASLRSAARVRMGLALWLALPEAPTVLWLPCCGCGCLCWRLRCCLAALLLGPPPHPRVSPHLPRWPAVTGLEAEIGKLLAAARAVEQQYALKPAAEAAGEEAQQHGAAAAAEQQQQQQGVDVAMQEA